MTKPLSMTFHESYGELPTRLLSLYRRFNVSPTDHDLILNRIGYMVGDRSIPWSLVIDFVKAQSESGTFRLPLYL